MRKATRTLDDHNAMNRHMEKSTLFIILDTQGPNMNFLSRQTRHDFVINSWLIFFHVESSLIFNSDDKLAQTFDLAFKYVRGIHFNSRMYVAVTKTDVTKQSQLEFNDLKLFEIYRRSEDGEVLSTKISSLTIENCEYPFSNDNFSNACSIMGPFCSSPLNKSLV